MTVTHIQNSNPWKREQKIAICGNRGESFVLRVDDLRRAAKPCQACLARVANYARARR